ncbi:helix-turn-helix domain-containing protein [Nonomuraea candida]|uniref:helix-turn-helix domain-containing protein n=1 Tax=Nonomuraea candida TaxID=359159 RepID=UPI0005BD668D|nr:helix-turn-helix transcriptional regulator [Nonomuraea candida]
MRNINTGDQQTAHAALAALGTRLRDIREEAGLMGRELAERAGWSASKVTRIELAKQRPSQEDLKTWARICQASDQLQDLLSAAKNIESMYLEHKRSTATGMKRLQDSFGALWRDTTLFRVYEPHIVPGIFQTTEYAKAILALTANRLGTPDDLVAALDSRMKRQEVLYEGSRRFLVIVEEQVLRTQVAGPSVMLGQLDRLLAVMSSSACSLGVIPSTVPRREVLPSEGFWIYDDSRAIVETRSAIITVTQKREITIYADTFARLQRQAVYGEFARVLIRNAVLQQSEQL